MIRISVPGGLRPWLGLLILGLFALTLSLPFGRSCQLDGSPVSTASSSDHLNGAFYFVLLSFEPLVAWSILRDGVRGVPAVAMINFAVIGLALLALVAICLIGRKKPPAWLGLSGGLATLTALHPTFLGELGFFMPAGLGAALWGAGSLLAVAACFVPEAPWISPR